MVDEFAGRGIDLVAVSSNTEALARRAVEEWGLERLTVGYGLEHPDAERWGLFTSAATSAAEPATFTEPGIFIVRPDGTLYASIVQTMPFSRPPMASFLKSLQWIIENDYPARGEAPLPPSPVG